MFENDLGDLRIQFGSDLPLPVHHHGGRLPDIAQEQGGIDFKQFFRVIDGFIPAERYAGRNDADNLPLGIAHRCAGFGRQLDGGPRFDRRRCIPFQCFADAFLIGDVIAMLGRFMHSGNDSSGAVHNHDGIDWRVFQDTVHDRQDLRRIPGFHRPDHIGIGGQHDRLVLHFLLGILQQIMQAFDAGTRLLFCGCIRIIGKEVQYGAHGGASHDNEQHRDEYNEFGANRVKHE